MITPGKAAEVYSGHISGWSITAHTDDATSSFSHCSMAATYKSGIALIFYIDKEYNWNLGLFKSGWLLTRGSKYEAQILVDNVSITLVKGVSVEPDLVMVSLPDSTFLLAKLKQGNVMSIKYTRGQYDFDLTGSGAALDSTLRCVSSHLSKPSQATTDQKTRSKEDIADATIMLANMLSSTGVSNYKILQSKESQEKFPDKDIVWVSPTLGGWLNIIKPTKNLNVEEVATLMIAYRSTECKGKFASSRSPSKKSIRVMTACDEGSGIVQTHHVVSPKMNNEYYVFGVFLLAEDDAEASPETFAASLLEIVDN